MGTRTSIATIAVAAALLAAPVYAEGLCHPACEEDPTSQVALVNGEATADAVVAGTLGMDVLYTRRDTIPDVTGAALAEYDSPTTVVIVGGSDAVSQDVVEDLERLKFAVERVAGADRYDTAAKVAARN